MTGFSPEPGSGWSSNGWNSAMPTEPASDDALVERARDDDERAYGELWLRHSAAAHAVARAYSSLDPDDLVAEAFARILAAIRRGGGPSMGFRPYLLTSVRNVAHEWGAQQQRVYASDLEDAADEETPDAEWSAIVGFESSAVAAAFGTLPSRWQEALWYSEVDGLKPRQFAPLLGLAPNAASALVLRARRGFRDAWVTAQLRRADSDECRETLALLGAHSRAGLARRDARRVEAHLATCEGCALAWVEARDVSSRLALVILPLVVGIPATASYTAWTQSGGAQLAVFALGSGGTGGDPGGTARVADVWRHPLAQLLTVAAAGAAIALATPLFTTSALPTSGVEALPVGSDDRPGAASTAPPSPQPSASESSIATTPRPTSTPVLRPVVDPVPSPDAPGSSTAPRPEPSATSVRPADPTREPLPTAPPTPVASPSPTPQPTPTAEPTPTPTPRPTPTPTTTPRPTPTPTPTTTIELPPAAPAMTVDTAAGPSVYPLISGTDAEPGALIEVVDADGDVWARTTADESGIWTVSDLAGGTDGTVAASSLPPGEHRLAARQSFLGRTSELSPAAAVAVAAPPTLLSPLDGATVAAAGFDLTVSGQPNLQVQRGRVGEADPWRSDLMPLDATGRFSQRFTVPAPGRVTIGVRYLDPATGRFGPASFASFSAR